MAQITFPREQLVTKFSDHYTKKRVDGVWSDVRPVCGGAGMAQFLLEEGEFRAEATVYTDFCSEINIFQGGELVYKDESYDEMCHTEWFKETTPEAKALLGEAWVLIHATIQGMNARSPVR